MIQLILAIKFLLVLLNNLYPFLSPYFIVVTSLPNQVVEIFAGVPSIFISCNISFTLLQSSVSCFLKPMAYCSSSNASFKIL